MNNGGINITNQKKLSSILITCLLLASLATVIFPILKADGGLPDYVVAGFVFVDGVPTDGVNVTLSVPGYEDINVTSYYNELYDKHGIYKISFYADEGQNASFTVKIDDDYFIPDPDGFLIDQPHPYSFNNVNLSVDTSSYNLPPDKPTTPSPGHNSEGIGLNPTLSVEVTDPDADTMNVSFYNASDDSLIGTDTNVANGSTASVAWSDLSYNTTYHWYAVANDSQLETKSDTWSFTTKETENEAPKVCITKPQRALYIFNKKILPRFFGMALIIGDITIIANATDEDSGIEKVEFYINGKLKGNDATEPYTYNWTRDRLRLVHIFFIKVVAYDNDGATAEDCMIVRKFL